MKPDSRHRAVSFYFTNVTANLPQISEKLLPGVARDIVEGHALAVFGALLGGTVAHLRKDGCERFELIPPASIQSLARKHGLDFSKIQSSLWQTKPTL